MNRTNFARLAGRSGEEPAAIAGALTMIMTMLHHAYGAVVFDTPWRMHVVPIALIAAILLLALGRARSAVPRFLLITVTAVAAIGWIGLFEGMYNHALRLSVFALAGNGAFYRALFGGGAYQAPSDVLFELTGLLQILPAAWAAALLHAGLREVKI